MAKQLTCILHVTALEIAKHIGDRVALLRVEKGQALSRLGRSIRIGLVWPAAKREQQIAANVGAMLVEWIVGREAGYEIRRKISMERQRAQRRERFTVIEKDFDRDGVPFSSNEPSGHFIRIIASMFRQTHLLDPRRDLDVVECAMNLSAQLHETWYFTIHVSIATAGHSQT